MKIVMKKNLTISPVFNIGFGYVKSNVSITGEYEFKSKIFLIPFFAFTYTECSYL
jgi:hypothetical protein